MAEINHTMNPMRGSLNAKVIRAKGPGMGWKVANLLRPNFFFGLIANAAAKGFSKLTGIPTITAELEARLIRADGEIVNFGIVCHRVVTDAGVAFLVDDWDSDATDITTMNYHGSGTGTGAEAAGDTALGTAVESRAAGTKSQPAANQLRTVATISYTATRAITEHGIFSASTAGTLWDRSVFAAINVANGDSIQFTYTCTINSGG